MEAAAGTTSGIPAAAPRKQYLHFYSGLGRLLRKLRPDVAHLWEEPWSIVLPKAAIVLEADQNILPRGKLPGGAVEVDGGRPPRRARLK